MDCIHGRYGCVELSYRFRVASVFGAMQFPIVLNGVKRQLPEQSMHMGFWLPTVTLHQDRVGPWGCSCNYNSSLTFIKFYKAPRQD